MDHRYLAEPYEFIPARNTSLYARLIWPFYRTLMRRLYHVDHIDLRGLEHFRNSVKADHGVILAPNHCRYSDPFVMGEITRLSSIFLYFCASWHLFRHNKKWQGWLMNRLGAMSIYREGTDRDCLRECQRILEANERPLILFPEGTFYRQNDRLGPLQDGVSFIARRAQKKNVRQIVVHPMAIKYWFVEDPRPAFERRICTLEQRCHVHPRRGKDYVERIKWIANALLIVKEMEILGSPQMGDLDERQVRLADHMCQQFEKTYFGKTRPGPIMDRIRFIRNQVVKLFIEAPRETPEWYELLYQLDDLAFAQQLFSHSWKYIDEWASLERISETVMRLEEDLYDEEIPMARMGCVIRIDEPMHVAEFEGLRGNGGQDALTVYLQQRIQSMLDELADEGPPAHWNAPTGPRPRDLPAPPPEPILSGAAS